MPAPKYEVEDDFIKGKLREIAERLGDAMPEGWGFAVFLMSHGENGATFYLSSLERAGTIATLKEWIAKAEADAKREVH